MSLFAAFLIGICQDPRPAAELVSENCDIFITIPDSPGVRRKLRKEPYKQLMADLTAALQWEIDPSRLLGLLGGEFALAIPDVQKDTLILIVDTGVKNNTYSTFVTRLMPDPWVRKEEDWPEGKVVTLTGPTTWYTNSSGRYFYVSTSAEALKALMAGKSPEKPLSQNAGYKTARERLKSADVVVHCQWERVRKKFEGLFSGIPAVWSAGGVTFTHEAIDIRLFADGNELIGLFGNAKMPRPEVGVDSDAVTIVHPVLERWKPILQDKGEVLEKAVPPLILTDRYEGGDWRPLLEFASGDAESAVKKFKIESFQAKASDGRVLIGTPESLAPRAKGDPIWTSEGFKTIECYLPAESCLMDYRTPRAIEYVLQRPAQWASEAKARGETVHYLRTAEVMFQVAPLTKHLAATLSVLETTPEGLSGRIVLRLKGR